MQSCPFVSGIPALRIRYPAHVYHYAAHVISPPSVIRLRAKSRKGEEREATTILIQGILVPSE